tara:strand:- start:902 stop:1864 length:963 start_codon:yes stop_codon:yes gene_type:complete
MNRLRTVSGGCFAAAFLTFGAGVADLKATWSERTLTTLDVLRRPVTQLLINDAPGLSVASSAQLSDLFTRWDYQLAVVRSGERAVPRLYISALPDDLAQHEPLAARKELFLLAVMPQVLRINEQLLKHRGVLEDLHQRQRRDGTFDRAARQWLTKMGELYGVDEPVKRLDDLLIRVDVIPPSLALAQAAAESGWGTSRFAVKGRALFGQWTLSGKVHGLIPAQRDSHATHKVRTFNRLIESVWSYSVNLNTHPAYADFRRRRAQIRAQGETPAGGALTDTLVAYSEKGPAYVTLIRRIIATNRLSELDNAHLDRKPFKGS